MLREHYTLFRRLHQAVDLTVVAGAYLVSRVVIGRVAPHHSLEETTLWVQLGMLGMVLSADTLPYEFRLRRLSFSLGVLLRRWVTAWVGSLVLLSVFPRWPTDRLSLTVFFILGLVGLWGTHAASAFGLRWWRRRGRSYKNALIVGTGPSARRMVDTILSQPERGVRAVGFLDTETGNRLWRYRDIPVRGSLSALPGLVKSEQIDFVVFCLHPDVLTRRYGLVRLCTRMGVPAIVITDWFAGLPARQRSGDFLGRMGMILDTAPRYSSAVFAKHVADRILALVGIAISLPVMAVVAAAIKLSSRGPVIFAQERLGRNGRRFTMWKFRTMVPDAEKMRSSLQAQNEMSGPVFKLTHDPRVTGVGRWLRRTSIDELPQLFNVLKGDMSLVGPRPPLPEEVTRYNEWQRRRLAVKPGLTCLWQVSGRSNVDFEDWMRLDMQYIDNWSMKKDAEILLKTIPVVLRGSGAK